nr:hypothetical protein [Tanacetum cinerariifolium]
MFDENNLYKIGLSAIVESSADEESLDEDIFGANDQDDTSMFNTDKDLQGEEVVVKEVNDASIATAITDVATTDVSFDELTMAQALVKIKTLRPKAKDKGKGIMIEEPLKMKKKDQISFDEQEARRLKAEIDEQDILAAKEAQKALEANNVVIKQWHDVQAKIDVDYELAQRLQAEEQEQLTDAKKSRLFMEFLEKRRKIFAAKRNEETRNRPPTKAQQRSIMSTYLQNMDGWKQRALKNKSFTEIKELFDKAMARINNFVDFRTELMEKSTKKDKAKIA